MRSLILSRILYLLSAARRVAYNILKFKEDKNFVNFSLISPTKIGTRLINMFSSRHEFVKDHRTAIGVSCGMASQSQIECVATQLKYPFHGLSLTMHCQDAERWEACVCSIAGKRTLIGQTFMNAITFQTSTLPGKRCNFRLFNIPFTIDVLLHSRRQCCI